MKFAAPRRRNRLIINVTSLIDVMFLLLIFFLVTSTFRDQPAIALDLPHSTTAEPVADGPAVVYLTQDGAIYLDDQPLSEAEVVPALRQRLAEGGGDTIVMRSDERTDFGRVVHLMDMIKESGFTHVSVSARTDDEGARLDGDAGGP